LIPLAGRQLARTASASGTGGGFWGLGLGAVAAIKPTVTFQAERGGRYHFFYDGAALWTLADRWIGKFLALLKLVITACTTVFVHRHDVSSPFAGKRLFITIMNLNLFCQCSRHNFTGKADAGVFGSRFALSRLFTHEIDL
jgi:hypothetical protein